VGHGEHAHKTVSYDTKRLVKDVFDKTAFLKFQISYNLNKTLMKHTENNKKSIGKSILAYGFKISRNNPRTKSLETLAKCL
jgi:hypothetical protein